MRWKGIIVFGVIFSVLSVFGFVFADGLIKNAIESTGRKVIGAQVEIAKFQLSFLKLFLRFGGLKIASSENEWRNAIEIKDIRFKMDWPALLEKKIVINEMAVDCIMRNTQRNTSGKLPEETAAQSESSQPSAISRMIQAELNSIPAVRMAQGNQKINLDEAINPAQLAAPAHIRQIEAELDAKSRSAEQAINNLNITPRLAEIKKQIDSVNLKEKNPAKLAQEIKKLADLKKDLDRLKNGLDSTNKSAQTGFNSISGAIKNIDNLKEQDYLNIINSVSGIKNINQENVGRMLFGEAWLGRMSSALYWLNLAKVLMPSRDEAPAEPPKKRFKGIDVEFPSDNSYPGFLLRSASITTGSGNNPDELSFSGKIEGISSNPRLYNKPATITMKGTRPDFDLEATLDHTKSISRDSARLNIRNFDLAGMRLTRSSSSLLPAKVASGAADIATTLVGEGNKIEIIMNILPRNLVFAPEDISQDEMAKQIAQTISTTKDLKITGIITMEKGRMTFKINSTVDDIVIGAVKKMADAKAEEVKNQVRKKLDQSIDPQKEALLKKFQSQKGALDSLIKSQSDAINDTAKQAGAKK